LDKLLNLDILIINALRIEEHYSHFNVEEAIAIAEYLRPKKTYFTHISHYISHEEYNKNLPKNMAFAYDGLVIEKLLNYTIPKMQSVDAKVESRPID
jgi:phosphoribosyl 1,2-cyclic phosphate phosphodiesterase